MNSRLHQLTATVPRCLPMKMNKENVGGRVEDCTPEAKLPHGTLTPLDTYGQQFRSSAFREYVATERGGHTFAHQLKARNIVFSILAPIACRNRAEKECDNSRDSSSDSSLEQETLPGMLERIFDRA